MSAGGRTQRPLAGNDVTDDSHGVPRRRSPLNRHPTGSSITTGSSGRGAAPRPSKPRLPTTVVTTRRNPGESSTRFATWHSVSSCGPPVLARSSLRPRTAPSGSWHGLTWGAIRWNCCATELAWHRPRASFHRRRAQADCTSRCSTSRPASPGTASRSSAIPTSVHRIQARPLPAPFRSPPRRSTSRFGIRASSVTSITRRHPRPWGMGEAKSQLGPGEYFVLGDNSPQSRDSRWHDFGPGIPERLLIGKPFLVYFPAGSCKLGAGVFKFRSSRTSAIFVDWRRILLLRRARWRRTIVSHPEVLVASTFAISCPLSTSRRRRSLNRRAKASFSRRTR